MLDIQVYFGGEGGGKLVHWIYKYNGRRGQGNPGEDDHGESNATAQIES